VIHPRIIAHRCGGALAPENTLAGLRLAACIGCKGVEFDAMLAADGVPVLIHDETLERTTTGRGRVAALDSATLIRLDAGIRHHPAFVGEPLPTLDVALRLCAALGLWANVEIKPAAGLEAETGRVVARHAAAATGGLLLSSFSSLALRAAAEEVGLPAARLAGRGDPCRLAPAHGGNRVACLARRGERTRGGCLCRRCAMRVFRSPVTRSIAAKTPSACLPWASARCLRIGPIFGRSGNVTVADSCLHFDCQRCVVSHVILRMGLSHINYQEQQMKRTYSLLIAVPCRFLPARPGADRARADEGPCPHPASTSARQSAAAHRSGRRSRAN
jgi:hypothetical protein